MVFPSLALLLAFNTNSLSVWTERMIGEHALIDSALDTDYKLMFLHVT